MDDHKKYNFTQFERTAYPRNRMLANPRWDWNLNVASDINIDVNEHANLIEKFKDAIRKNPNGYAFDRLDRFDNGRLLFFCWTTQGLYCLQEKYKNSGHDSAEILWEFHNRIGSRKAVQTRVLNIRDYEMALADIEWHANIALTAQDHLESLKMLLRIGPYSCSLHPEHAPTPIQFAILATIDTLAKSIEYGEKVKEWQVIMNDLGLVDDNYVTALETLLAHLDPSVNDKLDMGTLLGEMPC